MSIDHHYAAPRRWRLSRKMFLSSQVLLIFWCKIGFGCLLPLRIRMLFLAKTDYCNFIFRKFKRQFSVLAGEFRYHYAIILKKVHEKGFVICAKMFFSCSLKWGNCEKVSLDPSTFLSYLDFFPLNGPQTL